MVYFMDGTSVQCGLSIDPTSGHLYFWQGTPATVLATGTTVVVAGSWYFIEIKVNINNSTGSVDVRLAGTGSEMSAVNVDTQTTANAFTNAVQFFNGSASFDNDSALDDLYACDTSGPPPFNNYLGVIRIETLFPTSNNSVTWTPLANTNWQEVSEVNMDSDVSYNGQQSTGIDTFGFGGLSSTPTLIFGMAVISSARKDDVLNMSYRNKLLSGATTSNGTTSNLATVYQYVRDDYPVDPNTGVAWVGAGIDAIFAGYERF